MLLLSEFSSELSAGNTKIIKPGNQSNLHQMGTKQLTSIYLYKNKDKHPGGRKALLRCVQVRWWLPSYMTQQFSGFTRPWAGSTSSFKLRLPGRESKGENVVKRRRGNAPVWARCLPRSRNVPPGLLADRRCGPTAGRTSRRWRCGCAGCTRCARLLPPCCELPAGKHRFCQRSRTRTRTTDPDRTWGLSHFKLLIKITKTFLCFNILFS